MNGWRFVLSSLEIRLIMGITCFCLAFFGFSLIVFMRRLKPKKIEYNFDIFVRECLGDNNQSNFFIARTSGKGNRMQFLCVNGFDKWADMGCEHLENLEHFPRKETAKAFINGYKAGMKNTLLWKGIEW